ncbi:polyprenyl synthetase family protein [Candidatus Bathyarchaeota archaeon]|nr:polyprenyl synthetase family protein [Candidatus Bathyarchaeota archaeon]MBS7628655.1 polyprenyl synthetase family protein [Candidatus Bathyarchaeota archaeon]
MSVIKILNQATRIVDPIMLKYLKKGAAREFLPILTYPIKAGGKRVRPALTILSCQACGGTVKDAKLPAAMIELIHNYSLIMDDIIDHGEVRRGVPTVRAKYGDTMALLAGMFYREAISQIAQDSPNPEEMHELLINTIKQTIEGERMDILFEQSGRTEQYLMEHRYESIRPHLYFELIRRKTAELIRAACVAGAVSANASNHYLNAVSRYGKNIGLAFQLIDDLLDIFGEKTGKQKGKDIIEHKLGNAVIVYALQELSALKQENLLQTLRSKEVDQYALEEVLHLLESTKAKSKILELARLYVSRAKRSLEVLPKTEARENLSDLADFIVTRPY